MTETTETFDMSILQDTPIEYLPPVTNSSLSEVEAAREEYDTDR